MTASTECKRNGLLYVVSGIRLSLEESIQHCVFHGGLIVEITDESVFADLVDLQSISGEEELWVGLKADESPLSSPLNFLNIDSSPNEFTSSSQRGEFPWGSGQPSVNNNDEQTCVFMDESLNGLLNDDIDCSTERRVICQFICSRDTTSPTSFPSFQSEEVSRTVEANTTFIIIFLTLFLCITLMILFSCVLLCFLKRNLAKVKISLQDAYDWSN